MSFDEANPFPRECPKSDAHGMEAWEDARLYDEEARPSDPILEEARATLKLPGLAVQ